MDQQVIHGFDVFGEKSHRQSPFRTQEWNVDRLPQFRFRERSPENTWETRKNASQACWAELQSICDMPRDIQEALFETAMKGHGVEREELARLLHDRHPRTLHPSKPSSGASVRSPRGQPGRL
jgi:hypothetical protein